MNSLFPRKASCLALLSLGAFGGAALAQTASDTPSLKEVTVTGNPLAASELVAPATRLSGAELLLRAQPTLGETLDGTPGVSSSYFGPNASRPIVRGLDGDRIRILNNSGASLDASALSYDHAVPMDPLAIERIEVLLGPAALLYGGSAVGGVVNLIDNRIPREPVEGFQGKADAAVASGNREQGGALLLEGGSQRLGLHVDAFSRRSGDTRVPLELSCTREGVTSVARRICNSAADTQGGAVGASLFFDQGYLGASVASYRSDYGSVAEDEVTIGMKQNRYALEGEVRQLGGWLQRLKGQFSHSDYRHTEYDAGAPGTRFANQGNDLRIEARHRKLGALDGVLGLQAESARFSADGEEAFAPFSRSRQAALFLHEELATAWGKLSFGARSESVRVESLGNPDPAVTRFTTGSRSFHPHSLALGALVRLPASWQFTANLAATQRAPKDYELFANGPHVATGAWERGDPTLALEKSTGLDLGLAWKEGANRFALNGYLSRFGNYIGLQDTGSTESSDGEELPLFAYRGLRARFAGLEASGNLRLLGANDAEAGRTASTLDLALRGDLVRATNRDSGEPLPRIAPWRAGATLVWAQGPWGARLGFDHVAAQHRVPAGSRATEAYTLWNAALSYRQKAAAAQLTWYARLDNLTNRLAWSASSILTSTAFPKAPLPGRSLRLGVQALF
ncbi:TonB-dependent receptor [Ramlibacter sp. 2FC]|uniref:TonB-dependent receptor n=1 Tax=Ramlibacter sp. 2FC TaxID=2502188 RepID=UPI0010F9B057|nr:TonB-dependent receptor [Ramlibacter sp. 2FC]